MISHKSFGMLIVVIIFSPLNLGIKQVSACSPAPTTYIVEDLSITTVEDIIEFKIIYRNGTDLHHIQFDFEDEKFSPINSNISRPGNNVKGNWHWETWLGADCSTSSITYDNGSGNLIAGNYRYLAELQVDQETEVLYQILVDWNNELQMQRFEVINDAIHNTELTFKVSVINDLLITENANTTQFATLQSWKVNLILMGLLSIIGKYRMKTRRLH